MRRSAANTAAHYLRFGLKEIKEAANRGGRDVVVRKMQTRLMLSHGIRLAIGSLALCFTTLAGAQESLERGKNAAQLYAANCAGCHKSPQSVAKARGFFELESFLREHYSPSPQSAATLVAYLKGLERQSSGSVHSPGGAQYQPPPPPAPPPQRSDTDLCGAS